MVKILDTTLRDGEQTPGLSLTPEKKLLIAKKLDEIGVDIIEAGSAIVSEGEREGIKLIVKEGLNAEIASFSRPLKGDIDYALECGVDGVCMVVPTSDLHIEKKLGKKREDILALTTEATEYAKKNGLSVEILAEDGSRSDIDFLFSLFSEALKSGADRICVCDTVGVFIPERVEEFFSKLKKLGAPLAIHCHNDLGLAVANTLAGVRVGVEEVHCTVNGLGERAGNAALEEVALDLEYFYKIKTINIQKLSELSDLVELLTGVQKAPNKPIVGRNAFAHESGIHINGMLKCALTYEPITPEMVGQRRRFFLGKHSGRKAIEAKICELGLKAEKEQIEKIFKVVKEIGDKGKEITDADFQAIVLDVLATKVEEKVKLKELVAVTGNKITPTASVKIEVENKEYSGSGTGNGAVDAAINAIENALGGTGVELVEYHVNAITGGTDALVDVNIRLKKGGREISAGSTGTDIVMASVSAMVKGLNLLF